MYPDTQYLSGKEQEKVFKHFKKVIDKRDSGLITKSLYNHLHVHCDFIAHYDIFGFRGYYSGLSFREFVEHFDLNNPETVYWRHWLRGDYTEINQDMARYVTLQAPTIYAELDAEQKKLELALAMKLLEKHSVSVPITSSKSVDTFEKKTHTIFVPEANGQLVIGF